VQRSILVLVIVSGCGFRSPVAGDDAMQPIDGGTDAPADSLLDAPSGICIGRFVLVCRPTLPVNLPLLAPATINTDLDPRCALQDQGPGTPQVCVMAGNDIRIDAQITVIGSHPLVLAAFHDLNITGKGNLVLTSPRDGLPGAGANDPACHPATAGGNGGAGGGGGAGGSFGGAGGAGGTGDLAGAASAGQPGTPITPILRVTGGCKGSKGGDAGLTTGGAPGNGGGAVMLIAANKLTLAGTVTAGGGGGLPAIAAGGGGGGSGGFVGLDAKTYAIMGRVAANGGGGASGGAVLPGGPGSDGDSSITTAAPGGPAPIGGGAGGDGSIALQSDGTAGQNAPNGGGGGGGGGGAGVILVKGTAPAGGAFSPPLTTVP
jgi:hypothetical protein